MYSTYDDPSITVLPGQRDRERLKIVKYELERHSKEILRLQAEVERLESLPYVLDTPLPPC